MRQGVGQGDVWRLGDELSLQVAAKRGALAESGTWTELLRMYVRDAMQSALRRQHDGLNATARSSVKMDRCNTRAALQVLQGSQKACYEDSDAMCSHEAECDEVCVPQANIVKRMARGVVIAAGL